MPGITELWNLILLQPMLNSLVVLYQLLFSNFGLAIIVFTIIVRLITLPLTLRQLHQSKAMMTMQPKIQELKKKYGKDQQKLSQETMRLYKEHGVNPVGCAVPMLIQFPIWIGLYQSIIQLLADKPEDLLSLAQHLYPWPLISQTIPLSSNFLWLNLARPDPSFFILPVLVGGSMWVQQKMMASPSIDPKQASVNNMMQIWMPVMFGFFTVQFASGLALYWLTSNIIGIAMQYSVTGWGNLFGTPASQVAARENKKLAGASPAVIEEQEIVKEKKRLADGKPGSKRKDRRRSH